MEGRDFYVKIYFMALTILVMSFGVAKAEIYKYVDESGVVHFSNVPTEAHFISISPKKIIRSISNRSMRQKHYEPIINSMGEKYSVDPALIKAVIKAETDFNPNAISSKGASGIMQLMPQTASDLNVNNLFNAKENIEGGVKYLKYLIDLFNGNLTHAIAAYNAGENAVKKYNTVPPYPETQNYVRKVLAYYKDYSE